GAAPRLEAPPLSRQAWSSGRRIRGGEACARPGRPGLMKPILLCQRPYTKARLDYFFTIRRRFLDRFRH
ncbi:MAG TPA: hypothetical protein VNN23_01280, partial [Ornithinibacter sp.]|nr:hypothetical protein [Ornithinibacter sp.]